MTIGDMFAFHLFISAALMKGALLVRISLQHQSARTPLTFSALDTPKIAPSSGFTEVK